MCRDQVLLNVCLLSAGAACRSVVRSMRCAEQVSQLQLTLGERPLVWMQALGGIAT